MLFGALVFFVLSIVLFLCYRNSRKDNFFFRRAPQLKISELHSFDDAWISGIIETSKILVSPFFGSESVFYEYKLYKKKVKFVKDKNGQLRRTEEWDLFYSQADSTPFLVNDGSGKIAIDPTQAMKYSLKSESHRSQVWKHTLRYFPASGVVSAVGVTSENRDKLIKKGEIPLMITLYGRRQFMQEIQKNERRLKYGGFALIWLSLNLGFMKLVEDLGTTQHSHINMVLLGPLIASIPFGIFYYYFTYNSFVNLRRKVVNSWANIDVDLKNRHELIPSFISLIETYMSHQWH